MCSCILLFVFWLIISIETSHHSLPAAAVISDEKTVDIDHFYQLGIKLGEDSRKLYMHLFLPLIEILQRDEERGLERKGGIGGIIEPIWKFLTEDYDGSAHKFEWEKINEFKRLMENIRGNLMMIKTFCKESKGQQRKCQIWWLQFRKQCNCYENHEAKEIKLSYVQWFQHMKLLLDFTEQLVSPGKFLVKSWKELFLRATILIGSTADAAAEDYEGEVANAQQTNKAYPVMLLYNEFLKHANGALIHAEILVHGVVFTFQNNYGISIYEKNLREARKENLREKVEKRLLGYTEKGPAQVQTIIDDLTLLEFAPGTYDLYTNNCQHFAGTFSRRLLGKEEKIVWPEGVHPDKKMADGNKALLDAYSIAQEQEQEQKKQTKGGKGIDD